MITTGCRIRERAAAGWVGLRASAGTLRGTRSGRDGRHHLSSDRSHPPKEDSLAALGIDVVEESLADHLAHAETVYDVVVVWRPHNADLFFELPRRALPNASIVYDAEALYQKRLWIQVQLEEDEEKRKLREAEAVAMQRVETYVARFADVVVAISHEERDWSSITHHAPVELMVPLLSAIEMGPADPATRTDAVFAAGWLGGNDSRTSTRSAGIAARSCRTCAPRSAVPHARDGEKSASLGRAACRRKRRSCLDS